MVRVLVLGATGYIGLPLCQSLRRDGHTVYGLARSAEKCRSLAKLEIIPAPGTLEGGEYIAIVEKTNIDIVIDIASVGPASYDVLDALRTISEKRIQQRGKHASKLGFVHVSGTWVHGSSMAPVDDLSPIAIPHDEGCSAQPPDLLAWRPAVEQAVLDTRDALDSVIIRPALVYGGRSKLWSFWFSPIDRAAAASEKEVHLLADVAAQPGIVHVDDVVSAIHLTVAKFGMVSTASGNYPVFDVVSSSEPLKYIFDGAAQSLRFQGRLMYDGAPAGISLR